MSAAQKLSPGKVYEIAIGKLAPDPAQPRTEFPKGSLDSLAKSIKEHGLQVPLLVRRGENGAIVIKDGERRLRAAKQAGLKKLPVLLADEQDATERGLQQLAINQEHAHLTPFELAQFLKKLSVEEKLSPNEIAARLEKQGMKAMSRSHVANLIRLTDLPPKAVELLNEGKLEASAARGLLAAKDSPEAVKIVLEQIEEEIGYSGKATVRDVDGAVSSAFDEVYIDLTVDKAGHYRPRSAHADAPHFDWKKVCKGCPHLKEHGGGAWCMNAEEFEKKNEQAKADGLLIGGAKTKKEAAEKRLTPKQQKEADKAKREQRKGQLEDNARDYLHADLRRRCIEAVATGGNPTIAALATFVKLGRPGIETYELTRHESRGVFLRIANEHNLTNLDAVLGVKLQLGTLGMELNRKVALGLIPTLPWPETQMLAQHLFGDELGKFWKVDQAFLELLRKAELAEIAKKHCELPDGKKEWGALKVNALCAAILEKSEEIAPPPALQRLYEKIEKRAIDKMDIDFDSDTDLDGEEELDPTQERLDREDAEEHEEEPA